jgi:hypothetical protein
MPKFAGRILFFPLLLMLLNGCATVYKHPTLSAAKPRELALLPITVSLVNAKLPPKITGGANGGTRKR